MSATSLRPTLFLSDPTAEAEAVARALRAGGYVVVDVPLSMLVARAAVQSPRAVLVDADSHGALDIVARLRELPYGDDIPVLFFAAPGGAIGSNEEALAHEGSGFFVRPVDMPALIKEVEALTAGLRVSPFSPSTAGSSPPSVPIARRNRALAFESNPRPTPWPPGSNLAAGVSSAPPAAPWAPAPRAAVPPASDDLQRRLAEAERRAEESAEDAPPPSPEQELEAILPAELLTALDEPLEEDDPGDDGVPGRPPSGSLPRDRTHDGGNPRTTGGSGTGSGATPHGTGVTRSEAGTGALTPPLAGAIDERKATFQVRATGNRESHAVVPPRKAGFALSPGLDAGHTPSGPPATFAGIVGQWDVIRVVGRCIAARTSGSLCFAARGAERRILLCEGDVVTCASSADDESLVAFLGVRGELPRETVRRLGSRFPAVGRHAGAALVARGYLRQDQMWPTLRAHAEWVLGRILQTVDGRIFLEAQPPGRLAGEPSVFGGTPGAAVFVEIVRRIVAPATAIEQLGGMESRLGLSEASSLVDECGLAASDVVVVRGAAGGAVRDLVDAAPDGDFATTIFALSQLGILDAVPALGPREGEHEASPDGVDALDAEAIRERVRGRLQLVDDGDYFAVLGVSREATGYEIRRAFLELRRAFDPSRLLSPQLSDLVDDVRTIVAVLEEAYEILKDGARRERYRRAIEQTFEAP